MSDYKELIAELVAAAETPAKTIKKSMEDTGKKAIGCFPLHIPEEIIYACNYLPVGMWGGKTDLKLCDTYMQSFCCTIMRANLEYGMKGTYNFLSGIVMNAMCDTLKCVCEDWKIAVPQVPIIPVVYAQQRKSEEGIEYMKAEFKRVRHALEKLEGRMVMDRDVENAYEMYEDYRAAMRDFDATCVNYPITMDAYTRHLVIKAGFFMDKAVYKEKIKAITAGLKAQAPEKFDGIRVIATGLLSEPNEVLNIFKENNIAIVGDDLAQESRLWRTPGRDIKGSVWEKMALRMADQRGDCFLYEPDKQRGEMMIEMCKARSAKAVVVFMMKFCDPEEFDYPIYKKELDDAGVPHLYLEVDQMIDSFEQIRTRIQAFAEQF
ncbi:MAG: 2-hydroxyacyl-CoA dehydratase family protein [Oscillospiraceae bacterium]|nr:2-hydroxyacyl-CoA dehydratase family protein [Oscillospiraceae bacterium]